MNAIAAITPVVHSHELDDLIEDVQLSTASADEAMDAAQTFLRAGLAGATAGGITLSVPELQAVQVMFDLVRGRTVAAQEAAGRLALARLQGVK